MKKLVTEYENDLKKRHEMLNYYYDTVTREKNVCFAGFSFTRSEYIIHDNSLELIMAYKDEMERSSVNMNNIPEDLACIIMTYRLEIENYEAALKTLEAVYNLQQVN